MMPRFTLLLLVLTSGCNSQPPAVTNRPPPGKAVVPPSAPAKKVTAPLDIDATQAFVTGRLTDSNPLAARAHLPLPIRISGLSFLADCPQMRGWIPGIMAEGRYLLKMESSAALWYHADLFHMYLLAWNEDGSFIAQPAQAGSVKPVVGKVDVDQGRVIWDGESYSPVSSVHGRSSDILLSDVRGIERSSSVYVENRTINIDLTSPQRSAGMFFFGLGSVTVHTFGHQDGYSVFAVTYEREMGEIRTLYRLPITDCWARVELGDNASVAVSHDAGQSKPIFSGIIHKHRYPFDRVVHRGNSEVDSQYSIHFHELLAGQGREPVPGDQISARIWFYDAVEGESGLRDRSVPLLSNTLQGAEYTFEYGLGAENALLDAAVQGMRPGGWRRVAAAEQSVGNLRQSLRGLAPNEGIQMDVHLVATR